ncbi:MAG: hypothetical protein M2R45_04062 [Verrucomicrobia subdivision 3 bacterium]|nr:hypothetical protein [Limisphaerales bacterium]MCS1417001.1 hypothetical protein [Limisphaerales bacterium]
MNEDEARAVLAKATKKDKLAALVEALDALPRYETLRELLRALGRGEEKSRSAYWNRLRKVYQAHRLPGGIRWKVVQGEIPVSQAEFIAQLPDETDQYTLALAIVSSREKREKFSLGECKSIVRLVLKGKDGKQYSIREALDKVASFRFRDRPQLLDVLNVKEWIEVNKEAWKRQLPWESFCHRLITKKSSILTDIKTVETHLGKPGADLKESEAGIQSDVEAVKTQLGKLDTDLEKLKTSIQTYIEGVEKQLDTLAEKLRNLSDLSGE